jgi:hypothetical protein
MIKTVKNFAFGLLVMAGVTLCANAQADDEQAPVNYVHHIIVNDYIAQGEEYKAHYELLDPSGKVHTGTLTPGTQSLFLDESNSSHLTGTYVLHFHHCGLLISSCRSFSNTIFIHHNADVIWSLTNTGVSVTKTDL